MDLKAAIILHVIVAIPPTLSAVLAFVVGLRNHQNIMRIKVDINGRVDQLLKAERGRADNAEKLVVAVGAKAAE